MTSFEAPEHVEQLENPEDRVAIDLKEGGIDLRNLRDGRECEFEVDPDTMERRDQEEQQTYFDQEMLFKQLNYDCIDTGAEDDDCTPFERMSREMSDITVDKDGGVLKCVLRHGACAVVPPTALCRVHYNAYIEGLDEPFDSSYIRNRQKQFKLGKGEVIVGWEVAVATMKRGETSRFIFKPEYAFGALGCPPRIPANTSVLFEIQLISFVDQDAADNFDNFSEEERKQMSFDDLVKVVEALRLTGNEAFSINQYGRALGKYSQGLRLMENAHLANEREESKMKEISLKLCLNLSLCELKQNKHPRACKYARKALDIDAHNVKALWRLSVALRNLGEYKEAKRKINQAAQLDPRNKDITKELDKLNAEMERHKQRESGMAKRMMRMEIKDPPAPPSVPKDTKASGGVSKMTENMKMLLKQYESDPEQKQEITLPSNLLAQEISCIKQCASDLNLYMYEKEDENGVKSYKVSKFQK